MSDEPMEPMDVNDPLLRLEHWLDEDPEINFAEVHKHHGRWGVVLMQADDESLDGRRCVADAESATFEGAVAGAMLLAREFREGT